MNFEEHLKQIVGEGGVLCKEPMSRHTTFRVGGPAAFYVSPSSGAMLSDCIQAAKDAGVEYMVIGNGSNLLVSDRGFDGLVLSLGREFSDLCWLDETTVRAEAGASLSSIAIAARDRSLTGFEFAAGIPGSLGGACMMNAGAYGGEMKDVLVSVTVLTADGTMTERSIEEIVLGYRHSDFMERNEIVIAATLRLAKGDSAAISATMEELSLKRREKQPLEYPSAGSTFKRPEGYFAGALIEQAGLKGVGVGDACVSQKHAGFVVNKGKATAQDVYATICLVRERVKAESGIILEPEVRFIGDFDN